MFVAVATTTALAAYAYFDLEPVASRQSLEFDNSGFSGKSLTAVAAIGNGTAFGPRCDCTMAAVAANAVVAALAVLSLDRATVNQTAVTTTAAGSPVYLVSSPNGGGGAATTATAAARAKEVQALKTKGPAPATAAARRAHNNRETVWRSPWPYEDS